VERDPHAEQAISADDEDSFFDAQLNWVNLETIAESIGTANPVKTAGKYVLLNPVTPKMRADFELTPEKQEWYAVELQEQKKAIDSIEDIEKRMHAMAIFKKQESQLLLGLPGVGDRPIVYNPSPMKQFENVFSEIWRTLTALVTGSLNPKWMSGPLGIVQVVHDNWMIGIKEAIYWLAAISLNLGILNLLPIPVLDGGTVVLSFFEWITGKQIKPKTMERLILPFALVLIGFFVFLTYQDLSRILTKFLGW
jgi:regulator of sigma E protease